MPTINLGRVGFVNKGVYAQNTAYKVNDIVKYTSGIFSCLTAHTSPPTGFTDGNWIRWLDVYDESLVNIDGGTIDNTPIGSDIASTGAFTTLTASVAATLTALDNTVIGGVTPSSASFTSLFSASAQFTALDGTVIGGVTPAAGTFTSVNATSADLTALDGTAIGGTVPAAGDFTALTGDTIDGPVGSVVPATGAFTTLTGTTVDGPLGSVTPAAATVTTLGATTGTITDLSVVESKVLPLAHTDTGIASTSWFHMFDTRLDEGQGAWIENVERSWSLETLSTATRGARAKFPETGILHLTDAQYTAGNGFTIYDTSDDVFNMWKVFDNSTLITSPVVRPNYKNGVISFNCAQNVVLIDFAADTVTVISTTFHRVFSQAGSVANFNSLTYADDYEERSGPFINNIPKGTLLYLSETAAINPASRLRKPTLFVGEESRAECFTSHGDVFASTHTSGACAEFIVSPDDVLFYGMNYDPNVNVGRYLHSWIFDGEPTENNAVGVSYAYTNGINSTINRTNTVNGPQTTGACAIPVNNADDYYKTDRLDYPMNNSFPALTANDGAVKFLDGPSRAYYGIYSAVSMRASAIFWRGMKDIDVMCTTSTATPSKTNLLTNGNFASGLTGWTIVPEFDNGVTAAVVAGELELTVAVDTNPVAGVGTGALAGVDVWYSGVSQTVNVTQGKRYVLKANYATGTITASESYIAAVAPNQVGTRTYDYGLQSSYVTGKKEYNLSFNATSDTVRIQCMVGYDNVGAKGYFDNVQLYEIDDTNFNSGTSYEAFGAVTRTKFDAACEPVLYSNFSTSNYLMAPRADWYVGRLSPRAHNLLMSFWLKMNPNTAVETVYDLVDVDAPADSVTIKVLASGELEAETYDVAKAAVTKTSGGAPIDDGTLNHWQYFYDNLGGIFLYKNGELYSSGFNAAIAGGDVYDSSFNGHLGINFLKTLPLTNGTLSRWIQSMNIPFDADMARDNYERERSLFYSGATTTLGGTDAYQMGTAYDPVSDEWRVATTSGISTFKGIQRIAYEPTVIQRHGIQSLNGKTIEVLP